jgi:hypothetical protein
MPEPSESLNFITTAAALATRLSADEVTIYSLAFQSIGFGSWELEAGRRRSRVQVKWDGKGKQLTVSTAEVASGSTARKWQLVEEHDHRNRRPDTAQLFTSIEAAVRAHLGV